MSAQHTPGRLRLFQVGDHLEFLCPATEDGESILTITHEGNTQFAVVLKDADARRLVACWNACEGISTEALESEGNAALGWSRTASKLIHETTQREELQKQVAEIGQFGMVLREQRDELLAALKEVADTFGEDWMEGSTQRRLGDLARAAIAKVEGGAA